MAERQLTKRNYLGAGYVHVFTNDTTGEAVHVPCTKEDYERLGEVDGWRFNPTLLGHTWRHSGGGTIKVDTPNTRLGANEYCELPDGKKAVYLTETKNLVRDQMVAADAINASDMLDEAKLTVKIPQ